MCGGLPRVGLMWMWKGLVVVDNCFTLQGKETDNLKFTTYQVLTKKYRVDVSSVTKSDK